MPVDISIIILSLVTLVTGVLVTKFMIRINFLDVPVQRSSHVAPTPKCGGIAVVLAFLVFTIGFYLIYRPDFDIKIHTVLIASLLMSLIGLADDILDVNYKVRLLLQLLLSSIVVLAGLKLRSLSFPFFGEIIFSETTSFILSVLWLIAFTNAYNFIDGLNGLSAIAAIVTCSFIGYMYHNPISWLLLGLSFGALSFLKYNFGSKARIFLSDVGSYFIGFFIACSALALPYYQNDAAFLVIPFIFFLYIFDTFTTVLRRLMHHRNIFEAHRSHLFQLLNLLGWSHTQVSLFYGAVTFFAGLVSFKMITYPAYLQMYFFLGYLIVCTLYGTIVITLAQRKGIKIC